jgi:hypothetical protein
VSALLVLLALATPPANGEPQMVDPPRFQQTVDQLLADPEFRHLLRFREAERPDEEPPSEQRGSQPVPATPRPSPAGGGPPTASSPQVPSFEGIATGLKWLGFAALAAVLGWIVVLVVRLRRGSAGKDVPAPPATDIEAGAPPPGEQPPDEYLRQASAQARAGRHREAIRFLLLGAMSAIERRGLIRPRKGLTNGDYLRAVGREPPLRGPLEGIVRAFDEIHFGRRPATAERFEECLRSYRAGFA